MVTTSSISKFETEGGLIGCGIDAECVDRFTRWLHGGRAPSPILFSQGEIDHCGGLDDASAAGLCASFCCKEAVYKALRRPFNGPECELFWQPAVQRYTVALSERLHHEFGLTRALAWVALKKSGECLVRAYLFGEGVEIDKK
jgi:phosphopantetheinyl transferase (holo-ACP synthase)